MLKTSYSGNPKCYSLPLIAVLLINVGSRTRHTAFVLVMTVADITMTKTETEGICRLEGSRNQ